MLGMNNISARLNGSDTTQCTYAPPAKDIIAVFLQWFFEILL
jgi:hypothetical protein